jgi:hypothetical protein
MILEVEGVEVLSIEEVQGNEKKHLVKSHYDMVYHTILSYSNGVVEATVYNYLGELQTGYTETIIFESDGVIIGEITPTNGIAELAIEIQTTEQITIRTANDNMRNGEVIING